MSDSIPVSGVIPVSEMVGEDDEETVRLRELEESARGFLLQFEWCEAIREFYFGDGVGDVFGVFLARIEPAKPDIDEYLWIVVGNLPSAYLVIDDSPTPKDALEAYIEEMRKWVVLAKRGEHSPDVIPVNVPATPEWAEQLEGRLDALEKEIIPIWFVQ
ncbi:MAG: hypothetical protein ABSD61_11835 [Terracidiphilus sp.]|jgi:hypothetical protein